MLITRTSSLSGITRTLDIPAKQEDYDLWTKDQRAAPNIQKLFWYLTPDQREFILTGSSPEEWDKAFPEEDDEL